VHSLNDDELQNIFKHCSNATRYFSSPPSYEAGNCGLLLTSVAMH